MDYKVTVNGKEVMVPKDVYDEYRRNTKESRRERYMNTRSNKSEISLEILPDIAQSPSAEDEYIKELDIMNLHEAIDSLDEKNKFIITELFFNNRTEQEVANSIGMTQKGVNKRKARILELLKEIMENRKF